MFYYQILTNIKQTGFLTFSSDIPLKMGRVVSVKVKNRAVFGVVVQKNPHTPNFKTNPVLEVFDVYLPPKCLVFINLFAFHTFQNINEVFNAYLPSLNILIAQSKKNNQVFEIENGQNEQNNFENNSGDNLKNQEKPEIRQKTKNPVFTLENDLWFRIKYIIRSLTTPNPNQKNDTKNQTILFIFPEKSYLKKYFKETENFIENDLKKERENSVENLALNIFSSGSLKTNKTTLFNLFEKNSEKTNIIFGTRSLLFLPFDEIQQIYFFEENDANYIQEQNSLYFDTRDAIFYLSHVFGANLEFISTLPSIRLLQFYSKESLGIVLSNLSNKEKKLLKMKIYEQNFQDLFFNLFSNEILTDLDAEIEE